MARWPAGRTADSTPFSPGAASFEARTGSPAVMRVMTMRSVAAATLPIGSLSGEPAGKSASFTMESSTRVPGSRSRVATTTFVVAACVWPLIHCEPMATATRPITTEIRMTTSGRTFLMVAVPRVGPRADRGAWREGRSALSRGSAPEGELDDRSRGDRERVGHAHGGHRELAGARHAMQDERGAGDLAQSLAQVRAH